MADAIRVVVSSSSWYVAQGSYSIEPLAWRILSPGRLTLACGPACVIL